MPLSKPALARDQLFITISYESPRKFEFHFSACMSVDEFRAKLLEGIL